MRIAPIAAAVCIAAVAATSMAASKLSGADAARIMHERHEGMENIGKSFKALHRELDAASPDLGIVRASAGQIAGLSKNASGWFPTGTGPDIGKTGAKPEIWQNPQDFAAKLRDFQKAAQVYNATVAGNDVNAMKVGFGNLGGACKACHDKYRAEMQH